MKLFKFIECRLDDHHRNQTVSYIYVFVYNRQFRVHNSLIPSEDDMVYV